MVNRRECEVTEHIVYFRHHGPAYPASESSKVVLQTAAPSVVTDKPVSEDLQPRNPFPHGSWMS